MKNSHLSTVEFSALNLDNRLLNALESAGFSHCTPIQAESLPVALNGGDVAGQAQTGTGKTAAFLLAMFNRLLTTEVPEADQATKSAPRGIVIAPTRELAVQIHSDGVTLGKDTNLRLALAYGGTDYEKQKETIGAGIDVLIGTPGRLIDFYKQGIFTLNDIQVVVLDEADRMFDLGFIKDMRYLLRRMPDPKERLNMLFSATLSARVMELAYEHMNDPNEIKIESDKTVADNVREEVYYPANSEKIPLMLGILASLKTGRTLVFVNTRHGADKVGNWLTANGHRAGVLTGEVPQKKRESILRKFTSGETDILVATDVAARGLHIPDVSHVFNFDLPQDAEDYVHRIGRTARAGASGDAISFACEDYAFSLVEIEQYIGHQINRADIDPAFLSAEYKRPSRVQSDRSSKPNRSQNDKRSAKTPQRKSTTSSSPENTTPKPNQPIVEPKPAMILAKTESAPITTSDNLSTSAENVPEIQLVTSPMARPRMSKWNNPGIEIPAIG